MFFAFLTRAETSYGHEIKRNSYVISRSKVERMVGCGEIFEEYIEISNLGNNNLHILFSYDEDLANILEFEKKEITINPKNSSKICFFVSGYEIGNYSGKIYLKGDLNEEILVNISVVKSESGAPFLLNVNFDKEAFILKKNIEFKLTINKLKDEAANNASVEYYIEDNKNSSYFLGSENVSLPNSVQLIKKFKIPDELKEGNYVLKIIFKYDGRVLQSKSPFLLKRSFFQILIFGFIPMWVLFFVIGLFGVGGVSYYVGKKIIENKRKYKMQLDLKTIPKKAPGFFYLGNIAEKKIKA